MSYQSHTAIGVVVWSVPVTVVICAVVRCAASGVFAHLPDLGPLRLRSYRVLIQRQQALWVTVLSALIGGASHVVIDGFTHQGRWGANWLGLNEVIGELPLRGQLTSARVLQYIGHVGGSLLAVALFVHIGSRCLLDQWYGTETVAAAREVAVAARHRLVFWPVALGPPLAMAGWATANDVSPLFPTVTAVVFALVAAGTLPLYRETRALR